MAILDTTGAIKPTPGTPLPALPTAMQATYTQPISSFVVRSLAGNSAGHKVYLLKNNSAADTANLTNVLWYFEVPNEAVSFTSSGLNVYLLNQLFIDAEQAGDGVMITFEVY